VAAGTIACNPTLVEGAVQPRDLLALSVLFDHDVADGAPATRFVARLQELLAGAWGLTAPDEAGPASAVPSA